MGQTFGYARVSTTDQNLEVQRRELRAAGVEKMLFEEQVSGVKKDRPELERMLRFVGEGDKVVITKLDRLGRSTADLLRKVQQIEEAGATLQVLSINLDTSTANGKLMLGMLAVIAEFERDMLRERQAEGIAAAKERGVYTGRQPTAQRQAKKVVELANQGLTRKAIAEQLNIGVSSVYRILAQNKR